MAPAWWDAEWARTVGTLVMIVGNLAVAWAVVRLLGLGERVWRWMR